MSHDKFPIFIERVLLHEGGYVNNPRDPGGRTNFGITERVARAWGYKGDMRNLPRATAISIYRSEYWVKPGYNKFVPAIGFQLLDARVNHSQGTAERLLQRALGVADDGIIGPVTLAAANGADASLLGARFMAERIEYWARLSIFDTFGRGWMNRAAGQLRYLAEDST